MNSNKKKKKRNAETKWRSELRRKVPLIKRRRRWPGRLRERERSMLAGGAEIWVISGEPCSSIPGWCWCRRRNWVGLQIPTQTNSAPRSPNFPYKFPKSFFVPPFFFLNYYYYYYLWATTHINPTRTIRIRLGWVGLAFWIGLSLFF